MENTKILRNEIKSIVYNTIYLAKGGHDAEDATDEATRRIMRKIEERTIMLSNPQAKEEEFAW